MQDLIIVGISTTAKTIYQFVTKYNLYNVIGFAVNKEYIKETEFCGCPVYAIEDLNPNLNYSIFVAIQWNRCNSDRKSVYLRLKKEGFRFANLISPNAIVNGLILGDNCWITDMVVVDFGSIINNNVFVKVMAYVGPNTHICDHCFIGAKSTIGGSTTIGEQSFVGINSTIFDNVNIGKKCIVGAGTLIKRNMSDFSRSIVPMESTIIKQYGEMEIEEKLLHFKNVR